MLIRKLFHGAEGDKILSIINSREIRPNSSGEIFFSEYRYDAVFMHGADMRRKASFSVFMEVSISSEVQQTRRVTSGVQDTLVLRSTKPLPVRVLGLYVRKLQDGVGKIEQISGEDNIRQYLQHNH